MATTSPVPIFAVYQRLAFRNQVVAGLRWGMPALGATILGYLATLLALNIAGQQFSFAGIAIDRNQLTVASPRVSATGADGAVVEASAESAGISAAAIDVIRLSKVRMTRIPADASAMLTLESPEGALDGATQELSLGESSVLTGTDGLSGTLGPISARLGTGIYRTGPVTLHFPSGATIQAGSGAYESATGRFTFAGTVTVTLPGTPGEAEENR